MNVNSEKIQDINQEELKMTLNKMKLNQEEFIGSAWCRIGYHGS